MKGPCSVPGCRHRAHARGYCNTHYGQIWRTGAISEEIRVRTPKAEPSPRASLEQRKRQATLDLARARECYNVACGGPTRLRWRQAIQDLASEVKTLEGQLAVCAG